MTWGKGVRFISRPAHDSRNKREQKGTEVINLDERGQVHFRAA